MFVCVCVFGKCVCASKWAGGREAECKRGIDSVLVNKRVCECTRKSECVCVGACVGKVRVCVRERVCVCV